MATKKTTAKAGIPTAAPKKTTRKKIYVAYGSNMDFEQMALRCPDAEFLGVGMLRDWELLFKGSKSGFYATIEKKKGSSVPVMLWLVSAADEGRLDRYEGCPTFYYKKTVSVENVACTNARRPLGEKTRGMAYIMHEDRELGLPSEYYYGVLGNAYRLFGFEINILGTALARSVPKAGKA